MLFLRPRFALCSSGAVLLASRLLSRCLKCPRPALYLRLGSFSVLRLSVLRRTQRIFPPSPSRLSSCCRRVPFQMVRRSLNKECCSEYRNVIRVNVNTKRKRHRSKSETIQSSFMGQSGHTENGHPKEDGSDGEPFEMGPGDKQLDRRDGGEEPTKQKSSGFDAAPTSEAPKNSRGGDKARGGDT